MVVCRHVARMRGSGLQQRGVPRQCKRGAEAPAAAAVGTGGGTQAVDVHQGGLDVGCGAARRSRDGLRHWCAQCVGSGDALVTATSGGAGMAGRHGRESRPFAARGAGDEADGERHGRQTTANGAYETLGRQILHPYSVPTARTSNSATAVFTVGGSLRFVPCAVCCRAFQASRHQRSRLV